MTTDQEAQITRSEIIETLNDYIFGNFDIPKKVRIAIGEAVSLLQSQEPLSTEDATKIFEDMIETNCFNHEPERKEVLSSEEITQLANAAKDLENEWGNYERTDR